MNEEKQKPNCYECKWRRDLSYDAHSQCVHPKIGGQTEALIAAILVDYNGPQKRLNISGNAHGIRSGWFFWPANFDPVWLETCDGFESLNEGKEVNNESISK